MGNKNRASSRPRKKRERKKENPGRLVQDPYHLILHVSRVRSRQVGRIAVVSCARCHIYARNIGFQRAQSPQNERYLYSNQHRKGHGFLLTSSTDTNTINPNQILPAGHQVILPWVIVECIYEGRGTPLHSRGEGVQHMDAYRMHVSWVESLCGCRAILTRQSRRRHGSLVKPQHRNLHVMTAQGQTHSSLRLFPLPSSFFPPPLIPYPYPYTSTWLTIHVGTPFKSFLNTISHLCGTHAHIFPPPPSSSPCLHPLSPRKDERGHA